MTARRAALIAGSVMLVVYAATLAPSVTFWDAGEFIAAARTLGIPHPPGTPLFIIALNAWAKALAFLPYAIATNMLSAICTAGAVGLSALWVARATREPVLGLAAGITAGAMTSVWQNATETEVYAASLLVSIAAVVAADAAGRGNDCRDRRWLLLSAYLLALAVPLHLSVLVAAPVAIYLVAQRTDGSWDLRAGLALLGVTIVTLGVARIAPGVCAVGLVVIAMCLLPIGADSMPHRARLVLGVIGVIAVAGSGLLFMLVRARFDPAINQADPVSLGQLAYVISRRQYDVAGLLPRRAAWWLQIANWFEYADWQVALSLAPSVIPSVWRILATVVFAALGAIGSRRHRTMDRRSWRAVVLLFVCGSVGVGAYLNLKAGASFGWGIVPNAAQHEARDRDYFFVLSFWAWGLWAGMGALALGERTRWPRSVGLAVAALPIVLNWSAVSRRGEPQASLAVRVAAALLEPLPPRTVLFVAGDNDSYPLWYAQQVERLRRDVTIVTLPLLGAPWYAAELDRRYALLGGRPSADPNMLATEIAAGARRLGRPVAVAATVPASERNRLNRHWIDIGFAYLASEGQPAMQYPAKQKVPVMSLDTVAMHRSATMIEPWLSRIRVHESVDPVDAYFFGILECPRLADPSHSRTAADSLATVCNLR